MWVTGQWNAFDDMKRMLTYYRSWGARIVCQQLFKDGICKVGAMAHPSFMNESHVSAVEGILEQFYCGIFTVNASKSSVIYRCAQYGSAVLA